MAADAVIARGILAERIMQSCRTRVYADPYDVRRSTRSRCAADTLHQLGYTHVASVGGFKRWRAENLPLHFDAFDQDAADRYSRHLLLPEVGAAGQLLLGKARIALVGAGGLGSPAALIWRLPASVTSP